MSIRVHLWLKQNGWLKKITGNHVRDRLVTRTLRKSGWRVLRIWEHELAKKNDHCMLRLIQRVMA